jgi:hypothetical protein
LAITPLAFQQFQQMSQFAEIAGMSMERVNGVIAEIVELSTRHLFVIEMSYLRILPLIRSHREMTACVVFFMLRNSAMPS